MDETHRTAAITMLQDVLLSTAGVDDFLDGVAQAAPLSTSGRRPPPPSRSAATAARRWSRPATREPPSATRPSTRPTTARASASIDLGHIVHVPDLAHETRWPAWRAVTQRNGYASAAALPRSVRPGAHIALNLYATEPNSWNEAAIAVADMYADEIARAVTLSLRTADQAELNADLRAALVSRAVIDQAIGVVMAENRCTADEAMTHPAQRVTPPQGQAPRGRRRPSSRA